MPICHNCQCTRNECVCHGQYDVDLGEYLDDLADADETDSLDCDYGGYDYEAEYADFCNDWEGYP